MIAHNKLRVDFEYILELLQGVVDSELFNAIIDEIERDRIKYVDQDISVIVNQMRHEAIEKEIGEYAKKWYVDAEDVRYEVYN